MFASIVCKSNTYSYTRFEKTAKIVKEQDYKKLTKMT